MWGKDDEKKPAASGSGKTTAGAPQDDVLRRLRDSMKNDVAGNARRILKDADANARNMRDGLKFLGGVARVAFAIASGIGKIGSYIPGPLKWCFNKYSKAWNAFTHVKDKDGDIQFSKKRAIGMGLVTALAVGSVWPIEWPLGERGILADLAFYEATKKDEVVYLHMPEEPGGNHIYTADGAYSYPASAEDALHYEIKDSFFNDAWNFVHHGKKFFPDYVKSAIPAVPSRCEVHSYGFRWKLISRYGHMYPQILDVSCEPLGLKGDEGRALTKADRNLIAPEKVQSPVAAPVVPQTFAPQAPKGQQAVPTQTQPAPPKTAPGGPTP